MKIIYALLFLATGCGSNPVADPVKSQAGASPVAVVAAHDLEVAAASDLRFVLGDIIAEFEQEHPNAHVKPTYGASGSFFAQLSNRAPFDVFLSADISYPRKLIEAGLASEESLFSYAIGQIVVWVRNESPLDIESHGIDVLKAPSIKNIAIANPRHAPYGRAAESALKHFGLYDQIADRLVLGENVAQTAQLVETGAADIGIVAHSLVASSALRDKGRFWIVPQTAYPPIEQGGVIVSWARQPQIADQFRSFLLGDRSRSIFQQQGFTLPPHKTR